MEKPPYIQVASQSGYELELLQQVSLQQLPLFGKNSYHLLGRDAALVQRFDQALLAFQQSPEYRQLQLKYFQQANQ